MLAGLGPWPNQGMHPTAANRAAAGDAQLVSQAEALLTKRRYTGGRSSLQKRRRLVQTKDTVRAVLARLPDDCSLEDVLYHLYVVQAVARGRAEVEAGHTLSQKQVAEELRRKWLTAEK